jgi:flagellar basal body-associated protein FliL
MDEPALEQVRQELADIYEEMLSLPVDDYERRSALKDRQNELRQISRQLIAGQPLHDAAVLKAAYERLEQVRDRLLDQRLTHTSTSVGDAGIESTFTSAINKAIDAGAGLDEVEARLKEILDQMRSTG